MYKVELTVGAVSNRTDDTTPREAQLETAPTTREAIRISCIVSGTAGDFFNGQRKKEMVKIFPTFPQRLIDVICYADSMYKVELTVGAIK